MKEATFVRAVFKVAANGSQVGDVDFLSTEKIV